MGTRKRRYLGWKIIGTVVLLVALDFSAASLANRIIFYWPNFFEDIVARTDVRYTEDPKRRTYSYQDCEWHRAFPFYRARTCFRLGNFPTADGLVDATTLFYWSPIPIITRPLSSDLFYGPPGAQTILRIATSDKRILRDLRNE